MGERGSQAKQEGGGSFDMPFASVSCSRCSHFSPSHILTNLGRNSLAHANEFSVPAAGASNLAAQKHVS